MITVDEIRQVAHVFDPEIVKHTPLQFSPSLSERYGARIYLKREDLQLVRSFKIRGAYAKMSSLSAEEKKVGVVAASAGNHAQGVALSCDKLCIKGTIFMPQTTPLQKVRKTKKFGGSWVEVKLVGDTYDEACKAAKTFCQKSGSIFVHAFDDPQIIAGQGTLGIEVIEDMQTMQQDSIDIVLVAIGGGGLISGVGTAFKTLSPQTQVVGVESSGSASMHASFKAGKPVDIGKVDTFADGVAVKKPGEFTFAHAQRVVDHIEVVDDGCTATEMLSLLDDQGVITEPAGALSIAALEQMRERIRNKTVVCIVCGGNFDFARLRGVEEKSLRYRGLKRYFIITFPQRPGALREFLDVLGPDDDIVRFEYMKKSVKESGPALVAIQSSRKENFVGIAQRMRDNAVDFTDITDSEMYYDLLV